MEPPHKLPSSTLRPVLWSLGGAIIFLCFYLCIYNLFFHPLRKFPGPKRAAVGFLYEFYHDVIRDGQYLWQIEKMHEKYGPVVRINARELHIKDPEYYGTIYTAGRRKVNKDAPTVGAFSVPSSVASTVDHLHHRARRGYLNRYFSKRAIVGIEHMIHNRVGRLFGRLDESMRKGEAVCMDAAFSAMTADIITERFYGEHYDYVGIENFDFPVIDAFLGVSLIYHLARFFPGLVENLRKLPIPVIRLILPAVADFLAFQKEIERKIVKSLKDGSLKGSSSVIVGALGDTTIPSHERSLKRLLDEGTVIIFAGTETSSRALSVGLFHLLNEKSCLLKLREELMTLPPVPDHAYSLAQLEPLPYLTGVVHEALRLSFGPISRLPRVAVEESLQYDQWTIPAGTPISQSTWFMHTDPDIYPNPHTFEPERWIRASYEGVTLNKYLTSFTKGSRQCLGINMAFAELYITFARVALTYEMELYETTKDSVSIHHARIVGYPKKIKGQKVGRGEIRVKVVGKQESPKISIKSDPSL